MEKQLKPMKLVKGKDEFIQTLKDHDNLILSQTQLTEDEEAMTLTLNGLTQEE